MTDLPKTWFGMTRQGRMADRTRGNCFKLKEGRFRLDMRCWNRLPREAVVAPSLDVLKARLEGALSNLT